MFHAIGTAISRILEKMNAARQCYGFRPWAAVRWLRTSESEEERGRRDARCNNRRVRRDAQIAELARKADARKRRRLYQKRKPESSLHSHTATAHPATASSTKSSNTTTDTFGPFGAPAGISSYIGSTAAADPPPAVHSSSFDAPGPVTGTRPLAPSRLPRPSPESKEKEGLFAPGDGHARDEHMPDAPALGRGTASDDPYIAHMTHQTAPVHPLEDVSFTLMTIPPDDSTRHHEAVGDTFNGPATTRSAHSTAVGTLPQGFPWYDDMPTTNGDKGDGSMDNEIGGDSDAMWEHDEGDDTDNGSVGCKDWSRQDTRTDQSETETHQDNTEAMETTHKINGSNDATRYDQTSRQDDAWLSDVEMDEALPTVEHPIHESAVGQGIAYVPETDGCAYSEGDHFTTAPASPETQSDGAEDSHATVNNRWSIIGDDSSDELPWSVSDMGDVVAELLHEPMSNFHGPVIQEPFTPHNYSTGGFPLSEKCPLAPQPNQLEFDVPPRPLQDALHTSPAAATDEGDEDLASTHISPHTTRTPWEDCDIDPRLRPMASDTTLPRSNAQSRTPVRTVAASAPFVQSSTDEAVGARNSGKRRSYKMTDKRAGSSRGWGGNGQGFTTSAAGLHPEHTSFITQLFDDIRKGRTTQYQLPDIISMCPDAPYNQHNNTPANTTASLIMAKPSKERTNAEKTQLLNWRKWLYCVWLNETPLGVPAKCKCGPCVLQDEKGNPTTCRTFAEGVQQRLKDVRLVSCDRCCFVKDSKGHPCDLSDRTAQEEGNLIEPDGAGGDMHRNESTPTPTTRKTATRRKNAPPYRSARTTATISPTPGDRASGVDASTPRPVGVVYEDGTIRRIHGNRLLGTDKLERGLNGLNTPIPDTDLHSTRRVLQADDTVGVNDSSYGSEVGSRVSNWLEDVPVV